jgi:CheY-like chemotaxis protein
MKVLVVDPDLRRAPALKDTLTAGGAEVTVASSGSFALTMLEWNRHDVVVSRARIDDMDGHELCTILKSDPGTRDVRFVLVADGDEVTSAETAAAGVDLVLPPGMMSGAILPLVVRLVEADRAPATEPAAPPAPAAVVDESAAPPLLAPPVAPPPPPPPPIPRDVEPAPGVPRIRPAALPPPPADPPKSYATMTTAGPDGPWAKPAPAAPAASARSRTAPPGAPAGPPRPATPPRAAAPSRPAAPRPASAPTSRPPTPSPARMAAPAAAPTRSAASPAVPDLSSMPSGTFQGSLEVMELADLTQAIGAGGKTGRLILALPQGGGLMLFDKGRVVHAEYRNAVGEEAFGALLAASHANGAGRFCFLPTPASDSTALPRTIDKSVDQLLLSSATAIDEKG